MKKSTQELMPEVGRLIREGKTVVLPVRGNSMRPFIQNGNDCVELHPLPPVLRKGDVVLARTSKGYYVLHRVTVISPDLLTLEGDGNISLRETCRPSDVLARAEWVIDAHKERHSLLDRRARIKWRMWYMLRPLRRVLLACQGCLPI
ncbi:MAG: S24/S26 family peptidase [Prevotellaceae bacterium]|nr:S24/S26 family peptidase [Prevotellaceae bacterium]MDY6098958.1 S24/S26 family peptidase [Bacteroidaceae bacterium]